MNYHKLLHKQVQKFLPEHLQSDPAIQDLLEAVNSSYAAFDRDKDLAERAFRITEDEYSEINEQLKEEIEVKRRSVLKLKDTLGVISGDDTQNGSDDLLLIARYLHQQVREKKNAENIFTTLITNMQSGILLEDETRHIVYANQLFCDMFQIPVACEQLTGMDCSNSAEESKYLFQAPEGFVIRIKEILKNRKTVKGEVLSLEDGKVYLRDYIPIFLDNEYRGHLWNYTDITEIRKAQHEIGQSELKNRLIMNSALDAIITIDISGRITFWNPQAEKTFGWTEEEVLGKNLADTIIPPLYQSTHKRGMNHYLATGEGPVLNKQLELSAINSQGEEFPIELSIVPITQGDTLFFCSFIRDISTRKKNEEALRKSEQLWQFALEGAGDGVWEYNFQTGEVYFSKQYKKMLGYEENEFPNESSEWLSRIHPDDLAIIQKTDEEYASGKISSHHREYRIQHKSGHYLWILDRGMMVSATEDEKPLRIIGTHTDITERKLAEQGLRINEEKYRSIITNMNLGLLEVDTDERIQFINNSFCEMSGYMADELIGRKASELFVRSENAEIMESKNELRKRGMSDAYEIAVKNKRGELKWWLISGAPRFDDKGQLIGSIGIHLDITQQKALEYELIEARELAEQSARSQEMFLANMSHEIRTPLNAIMGMSRELQKTALTRQQKSYLEAVNSAGEQLLVVINDILDISKIQAGKLHIENIGFRLREIGDRVMQVMSHRAEEKGISLVCSTDTRVHPVLIGDPYRLNQVLLNLISNGIKFTEKGTVEVICKVEEDNIDGQRISFTVKDTGIGMDKEFTQRIFENFSQEDRSVARRFGGTGLGMAISKQLVSLMNGDIQVESEKGVGTKVYFWLSFRKGSETEIASKAQVPTDNRILNGKKILLAEDNEMNRLVATTVLQPYGTIIEEVINGQEAVEAIRTGYYDLVLMDVQMPIMDGLEATRRIRRDLQSSIPIIALTANAIKGENEICFAAGMNDYLTKPFKEEDLVSLMAKWMGGETGLKSNTSSMETNHALFDLGKLREIGKGNQAFIDKMIKLFSEQAPLSVQEIKEAYDQKDLEKVKAVAHRLKPSIDNMGIHSLTKEIRQIETLALSGDQEQELPGLIEQLETVLVEVVGRLQES